MGALAMLGGCDLSTKDGVFDRMLWSMLRFNDRMQAALFRPEPAGCHVPPRPDHQAVQVQRLLPDRARCARPTRTGSWRSPAWS